jgi:hypothetical protein
MRRRLARGLPVKRWWLLTNRQWPLNHTAACNGSEGKRDSLGLLKRNSVRHRHGGGAV